MNSRIYEELSSLERRALKVYLVVEVLFVLLVFAFWKIQILDHQRYWNLSESNRTREVTLLSPRGLITDRNGVILAKNEASFKASIIRENCQDFNLSSRRTGRLLGMNDKVLKERIKKYEFLPLFKPVVIKDDLSFSEVSRIEGRKLEMPELMLQMEPKRSYPFGRFASHVLGYLQELSPEDMEKGLYSEKRWGRLVGKTGIERQYDNALQGTDGTEIQVVDHVGRVKESLVRKDPIPGDDIRLTLDFDIQKKAENLLQDREGAVVVLDVKKGEILALASYPDYDPNKFIHRFTPEEWLDLIKSPEFPLENRAIRGLYAPGSVFKLTVAIAALDSELITERTSFYCSGGIRIYGHLFSCWFQPGHGSVSFYKGIKHSCNIYFYQLGKRLGIEKIHGYATMLGFGTKTGVDIPGEKKGLVPSPEWKKEVKKAPWFPGETISVAIGQGPLLVTPLQVAFHTALIANKGVMISPHLFLSSGSPKGRSIKRELMLKRRRVKIKPSAFEKVIKGMWQVVNQGGTGRAAKISGYDICGKTGSTQLVSRSANRDIDEESQKIKTHSWFAGFAPKDDPKVAVTVLVEYGGMGGATAAPLARELLKIYKKKYD
ncbi:MAG: penicillin-binding protein 2 [Candidatus Aminicenantes bacterium]